MSLADSLSAPPKARPRRCAVGRIIDALSTEDGNALVAALQLESGFTTTDVLSALRDEGHPISHSTVLVHRKGGCSCGSV